MKIRTASAKLFLEDGRTAVELTVVFRSTANAPKTDTMTNNTTHVPLYLPTLGRQDLTAARNLMTVRNCFVKFDIQRTVHRDIFL